MTRHADEVLLENCRLRVSRAGRERVRRTGRKTVHAWVEGTIGGAGDGGCYTRVRYNPFHNEEFVDEAGRPVTDALRVHLTIVEGRPLVRVYNERG